MRRIDNALNACPTWQLDMRHLSPTNLVESERHIYFRILASKESQLADILILMLANKIDCCLIDCHSNSCFIQRL